MGDIINLVSQLEEIGPNNRILTVQMSEQQYKHLLYCADYVEKIRERNRQGYYNRKERDGKQTRKKILIPGTETYEQYTQVNVPVKPLQLVVMK